LPFTAKPKKMIVFHQARAKIGSKEIAPLEHGANRYIHAAEKEEDER
jgi:hypothetical protein